MERLAQLPNNTLLLMVVMAMSCHAPEASSDRFINRNQVVTKTTEGILYINDAPFTGTLFTIHENGISLTYRTPPVVLVTNWLRLIKRTLDASGA